MIVKEGDGVDQQEVKREEMQKEETVAAEACELDCQVPSEGTGKDHQEEPLKAEELQEQLARIEELQKQLEEATQKRDEYLALAQRAQADFDNYRKRNRNAIAEAYRDASAETIGAFLPVLDNLERALDSSRQSGVNDAFYQGIEMIVKQFRDVLTKMGVEEIPALGQPFNPEVHNAVMQVESDEEHPENTVVEILQKGYRLKDKIIRYSLVKVAK